jgi:hypothetical protein
MLSKFLVVALLGFAALGYRFLQRQSVDIVKAAEFDMTSRALNRLGSHQALSIELSVAEDRLENMVTMFPAKLSGPATVSRLIRMPESSNLAVSDVQTPPGTDEEINDHIYHRLSIVIQMEGTLDTLRLFLVELENGTVTASRIDHLIVDMITPSVQADGFPQYNMEIGLLLSLFSQDPLPEDTEPEAIDGETSRRPKEALKWSKDGI